MVLFFFFSAQPKTLVNWAVGMLAVLVAPFTLSLYAVRDQLQRSVNTPAIQQAKANYGEGSILDIWQQNWVDWSYANNLANLPFLALSLIPMFLFGMFMCKKRWLHEPGDYLTAIKTVWAVTGVLFVAFKAGPNLYGNPQWMQLLQDNVGGTASAIFYVLSITLLFRTKRGARLIHPLTWVGKMSLTNYIFQSVFSFLLFYSVGFGLYGQVSPLISLIIVVTVFALQIIASKAWLKKYKYGPFEWLWRTLTYGKRQPLKRKQSAAS